MNYVPYTYLLRFKPTGQLYYGSRYCNGKRGIANPSDLWTTYFTSSKVVEKLIEEHGKDSFEYEIRKTFKERDETAKWEDRFLKKADAKNNPRFLNKTNGYGEFAAGPKSEEHRKKLSTWQKGKPKPPRDDSYRASIAEHRKDRLYITDGDITRNIKKDQPIPHGWIIGTAKGMTSEANKLGLNIFRFIVKSIISYTRCKQTAEKNTPKVKYIFTEEHGKNISLAKAGIKFSKQHVSALNLSRRNNPLKWITNGTDNKLIPKTSAIPTNWAGGRTPSKTQRAHSHLSICFDG